MPRLRRSVPSGQTCWRGCRWRLWRAPRRRPMRSCAHWECAAQARWPRTWHASCRWHTGWQRQQACGSRRRNCGTVSGSSPGPARWQLTWVGWWRLTGTSCSTRPCHRTGRLRSGSPGDCVSTWCSLHAWNRSRIDVADAARTCPHDLATKEAGHTVSAADCGLGQSTTHGATGNSKHPTLHSRLMTLGVAVIDTRRAAFLRAP